MPIIVIFIRLGEVKHVVVCTVTNEIRLDALY